MHHCQYCQRRLYEPLQFCSTACAALFHQVRDPLAWAAYQARYPERQAARRAKRKARVRKLAAAAQKNPDSRQEERVL